MQNEHPVDRFARRIRGAVVFLAAICLPVFLVSYGWMLVLAYYAWPGWAFAIAVGSQILGWLGVSALFDSRQERRR